jgi:hypothetical protein
MSNFVRLIGPVEVTALKGKSVKTKSSPLELEDLAPVHHS